MCKLANDKSTRREQKERGREQERKKEEEEVFARETDKDEYFSADEQIRLSRKKIEKPKKKIRESQLGTNPPFFVPRKNRSHRYTASVAFNNA